MESALVGYFLPLQLLHFPLQPIYLRFVACSVRLQIRLQPHQLHIFGLPLIFHLLLHPFDLMRGIYLHQTDFLFGLDMCAQLIFDLV